MNSNKIVTGINTLLEKAGASFRVGVQVEVKMMAETKTKDGVVVATPAEEFAEGVEVFVLPAEGGEPVPAPDGIHILEDETTIEVLDGKIVSIKAKEVEETEMSDDVRQAVEALAGRVSELEGQLNSATAELSTVKSENETLKTDLAKVKSENAKLAKVPATNSVKETKREVEKEKTNLSKKSWSQMSQTERVLASLNKN
jgi:regulator of replication initiation timing